MRAMPASRASPPAARSRWNGPRTPGPRSPLGAEPPALRAVLAAARRSVRNPMKRIALTGAIAALSIGFGGLALAQTVGDPRAGAPRPRACAGPRGRQVSRRHGGEGQRRGPGRPGRPGRPQRRRDRHRRRHGRNPGPPRRTRWRSIPTARRSRGNQGRDQRGRRSARIVVLPNQYSLDWARFAPGLFRQTTPPAWGIERGGRAAQQGAKPVGARCSRTN